MHSPPLSDHNLHKVFSFLAEQETFVFLETGKIDRENHCSYIFTEPIGELIVRSRDNPKDFFSKAERYLNEGYYLAGWSAYELGYNLEESLKNLRDARGEKVVCQFGIFPAPIIFDHRTNKFSRPLPRSIPLEKIPNKGPISINNILPNQNREEYLKKIRKIKNYIAAGDTYQVNYTLKLLFDFYGRTNDLYESLRRSQSVAYGAYMKFGNTTTLSFSPELFFRKNKTICTVRPMKGTAKRGRTLEEDRKMAAFLQSDPKNKSENVMIVDLLRNDLGRLASSGSVKTLSLFDIETYRTLHQMTSTIAADLNDDIGLQELFQAMFPCGSVTGAPKIRTMEIIHELELEERGVYTGGIGFISPKKDMVFNVPIRTVTLNENRGEMGIGSGIVHDSDPENEWQECLLKGRFLTERPPKFQLIETILWTPDEGYWLFKEHIERLKKSAEYFHYPTNNENIMTHLTELEEKFQISTNHNTCQKIRLLLHSDGKFTSTHSACPTPLHRKLPMPPPPKATTTRKRIKLSHTKTDQNSPYLYHKTTIRELYNTERKSALEEGFAEVIFQNKKNEITEGSITNIMIYKDGKYFTPPVSSGLLPGTFRDYLLENFPDLVTEKILFKKDMVRADAIYLTNSIRGLVQYDL